MFKNLFKKSTIDLVTFPKKIILQVDLKKICVYGKNELGADVHQYIKYTKLSYWRTKMDLNGIEVTVENNNIVLIQAD